METNETTKKTSLCPGCCIHYSHTKNLSEEQIFMFFLEHGVITKPVNCLCGTDPKLSCDSAHYICNSYDKNKNKRKRKKFCRFKRSVWAQTFFHNSKVSVYSIFRLVSAVLWLMPPRNKVILHELGEDSKNILSWFLSLREVFIDAVSQNSKKLGGEGLQVELAAAKWKSDNLKGGVWDWSLGGIDHQSGETFLAPVENYNFESLKMMISEKINPGSIIITNCIKSFTDEQVEDLKKSLNVTFVHPAFCQISAVIKHHWSEVCKGFTSLSSERPPHSMEQLAEYLFKSKHPVPTERIHAFFIAAADLWPPGLCDFVSLKKNQSIQNNPTNVVA